MSIDLSEPRRSSVAGAARVGAWPSALAPVRARWSGMVGVLALGTLIRLTWLTRHVQQGHLEDLFALADLPVLVVMTLALYALGSASRWPAPSLAWLTARPGWCVLALAAGASTLAFAGWFLVCRGYPLSMDEFMASFDSAIFRRGRLFAPVPPVWRSYVPALQPLYGLTVPGNVVWASNYLPINAMLRAGFTALGGPALAGAVLVSLALAALFGIARRLWPARPEAALVAVILLATSAQFLITAMTPFAVTAHLALNLAWLWLFLRPGWASQLIAAAVACLACGLHQLIFHPLFAAPFVLELWLARRWTRATFHTIVYAAAAAFWISYQRFALQHVGVPAPALGAGHFGTAVIGLLAEFRLSDVSVMVENVLRFAAWQNPLLMPLALLGAAATWRARGPMQSLSAGLALTLLAVTVLMPIQNHGWGYRYLHGLLGNACLLATHGWLRLTDRLTASDRRAARSSLAAMSALALVMLLFRVWQVDRTVLPYAEASAAIAATPADVVLVDGAAFQFGVDLVRNDPFLNDGGPKILDLQALNAAQIVSLCRHYHIALFGRVVGAPLGLPVIPPASAASYGATPNTTDVLCVDRQGARSR